eukprot:TRINITY_DN13880_c0_g1_i2.p1 TRINITY_DN13880_c0_g1~~TRINITY_DN13880_c0_g1_i2.p1  ORF type:complete len:648 (-),score=144.32 TRINITY_DN13880_c0_g1_i2:56-1900(-)
MTYNLLIELHKLNQQPQRALGIFSEILQNKKVAPSISTFNQILYIAGVHEGMEKAKEIFLSMANNSPPIEPNVFIFRTMIDLYKKRKLFLDAYQFFTTYCFSSRLDEAVFNSMLEVVGQIKGAQGVKQFYSESVSHGFRPNSDTFSELVKTYSHLREPKEIIILFHTLRSENKKIDLQDYFFRKTLMAHFELRVPFSDFQDFFDLMKSSVKMNSKDFSGILNYYSEIGVPCSVVDYILQDIVHCGITLTTEIMNNAIKSYSRLRIVEKAEEVFREMRSRGVSPDHVSYTLMIGMYKDLKCPEKAVQIFEEMKSSIFRPNHVTYTYMGQIFFENREPEKSFALMEEMKAVGISPTRTFYNSLLHIYATCNQTPEAEKLFDLMKRGGRGEKVLPSPDLTSYGIMIHHYGTLGRLDVVSELISEIRNIHEVLDDRIYNTLLGCYCAWGLEAEAIGVMNEMIDKNVIPSVVTFNSFLSMYSKFQPEKGFPFLEDWQRKFPHFRPDSVTFSLLIKISFDVHGFNKKKLGRILSNMKNLGIPMDVHVYNSLISIYSKLELMHQAEKVYQIMMAERIRPNSTTFYHMKVVFGGLGKNSEIERLFFLIKDRHVFPSLPTIHE